MAPYRTIVVGRHTHYAVKVSPEDYDFLMRWRWTFAVSHPVGSLVYARRSVRDKRGKNVTVLMHRVVLIERMGVARPLDHFVDHVNGDSLDNRRGNLRWVTHLENMFNRQGIRAVPLEGGGSAVLDDVPF